MWTGQGQPQCNAGAGNNGAGVGIGLTGDQLLDRNSESLSSCRRVCVASEGVEGLEICQGESTVFFKKLFGGKRNDDGKEYELVPFDGDQGKGFVIRRTSDGQKLNWRGLPKSAGLESLNVVGVQHTGDALQGDQFGTGQAVKLVPEPDNQFDPNAVAVWDAQEETRVGYLPKEDAARYRKKMEKDAYYGVVMWEAFEGKKKRTGLRILIVRQDAVAKVRGMSIS